MTRLQRLLLAADAMRDVMQTTGGVYSARRQSHGSDNSDWLDIPAAAEFLDALAAFDDVEREAEE